MIRPLSFPATLSLGAALLTAAGSPKQAVNPVIHADVPDIAMVRVGDNVSQMKDGDFAGLALLQKHCGRGCQGGGQIHYATRTPGGFVDFDHFWVSERITRGAVAWHSPAPARQWAPCSSPLRHGPYCAWALTSASVTSRRTTGRTAVLPLRRTVALRRGPAPAGCQARMRFG